MRLKLGGAGGGRAKGHLAELVQGENKRLLQRECAQTTGLKLASWHQNKGWMKSMD